MGARMTVPTRLVLTAFLEAPDGELYGKQISQLTGVSSGTLYPVLRRQVDRGRLVMRMEKQQESPGGRPLRKYYQLTPEGRTLAEGARKVSTVVTRLRKAKRGPMGLMKAEELARLIGNHPVSTVMEALHHLGMKVVVDLIDEPAALEEFGEPLSDTPPF